jgi:hypothetical protein
MRPLFRYFVIAIATVIAIVILSACVNANATVVTTLPGNIKGSFRWQTAGTTPAQCSVPAVVWTASSPSQTSRTFTSTGIATTDNIMSTCSTVQQIEGPDVIKCYCPAISVDFTSLTPGIWTITAAWTNPAGTALCRIQVQPNKTATFDQVSDAIGCATGDSPPP